MAIERLTPGTIEWEAYYYNHIMRYQFAGNAINKESVNSVLDAACGVGFGTKYLSGIFSNAIITGIDRSDEALVIAKKRYAADNIRFMEDDCHTLNSSANFAPFDVIVSFETLEHLPKPSDFLKSCLQNLKSKGKIIVSTPNQLVSSPDNIITWEFHEKEYSAKEFYDLLQQAGFINIQLYGQQLSHKGKIKSEIRSDLNQLWSNPLIRFGRWIQEVLRGRKFDPVLKETLDDLEIVAFNNTGESDKMGINGPFVLIAIAEKN